MIPPPPRSTPFPYTTLFRSVSRTVAEIGQTDAAILGIFVGEGQARSETDLGADDAVTAVEFMLDREQDRKSTRLDSSHGYISYAVFCLKKKKKQNLNETKTI